MGIILNSRPDSKKSDRGKKAGFILRLRHQCRPVGPAAPSASPMGPPPGKMRAVTASRDSPRLSAAFRKVRTAGFPGQSVLPVSAAFLRSPLFRLTLFIYIPPVDGISRKPITDRRMYIRWHNRTKMPAEFFEKIKFA